MPTNGVIHPARLGGLPAHSISRGRFVADTVASSPVETEPSRALVSRLIGVLTSPRATYADITKRPRWLGALAVIVLISAIGITVLFSTSVGQRALLDQQVRTMESFGMKVSDAMYQ